MLQVIPSSLTQPPVPTSWESKLVAALPLPNLDICEAIQPAIPHRDIQELQMACEFDFAAWVHSCSCMGNLFKISWIFKFSQLFLQQKKHGILHLDARFPTCMTSGCGWRFAPVQISLVETHGPMDRWTKNMVLDRIFYHNWYRTLSEQLPIQSLEASHLCKTQTAPIFCNNVVIIYYVSDCSDDYYYITNSLPDLHCKCWSSLLIF